MAALPPRKYNEARVQAELAGKTSYPGAPCKENPEHVDEDGTTMRDTIKYRCLQCRQVADVDRKYRRRHPKKEKVQ